jgi:hypothetical protein
LGHHFERNLNLKIHKYEFFLFLCYTIGMLDIKDYWKNKQEEWDENSEVPQGVKELFNIYFHTQEITDNIEGFNVSKSEFTLDADAINNELKIQDIVGHTILGLALAKSQDITLPFELLLQDDSNHTQSKNTLNELVHKGSNSIIKEFQKNSPKDDKIDSLKHLLKNNLSESQVKPMFVKDLFKTIDDDVWYEFGLNLTSTFLLYQNKLDNIKETINEGIKTKKLQIEDSKLSTLMTMNNTLLKVKKIQLDKDLHDGLDKIFEDLFDLYKPIIRANKVYEVRKELILLEWFDNNFEKIEISDQLPIIDSNTLQKLDELTTEFSKNIDHFITNPESKISEDEALRYSSLSKSVYHKFGDLMRKYLKSKESINAISKGLENSIKKDQQKEDVKKIVNEFLRQFDVIQ